MQQQQAAERQRQMEYERQRQMEYERQRQMEAERQRQQQYQQQQQQQAAERQRQLQMQQQQQQAAERQRQQEAERQRQQQIQQQQQAAERQRQLQQQQQMQRPAVPQQQPQAPGIATQRPPVPTAPSPQPGFAPPQQPRPGVPPTPPTVAQPRPPGTPGFGQVPTQPGQPTVAQPRPGTLPGQPGFGQVPTQPGQPSVAQPRPGTLPGQPGFGQAPTQPGQPTVAQPRPGTLPGQPGFGQVPTQPGQPTVAQPRPGTLPGQPGFGQAPTQPGQPSVAQPRPGTLPGQPGFGQVPTQPGQPGVAQPRPGTLPGQPGFAATQPPPGTRPGTLPGQPGYASTQLPPGQPAPGQPRPGVLPGQPGYGTLAGGVAVGAALGASGRLGGGPAPAPATTVRPQPVQVGAGTVVTPRPDGRGHTISDRAPDGRQTVINSQRLPNGDVRTIAYSQTRDTVANTQQRVYLDGRRLLTTPQAVTVMQPGRPSVTRYHDGRREAFLPGGRPYYRETFIGDAQRRILRRTVFATVAGAAIVALAAPYYQDYYGYSFAGTELFAYAPPPLRPALMAWMGARFAAPVMDCAYCPPGYMVAEGGPPPGYATPYDMLGDMQLATGFEEGALDYGAPPDPRAEAEVMALTEEVEQLQARLSQAESLNKETRDELIKEIGAARRPAPRPAAPMQAPPAAPLQVTEAPVPTEAAPAPTPQPPVPQQAVAPVRVPQEVLQQVRAQVREEVAAMAQGQPHRLADILTAPGVERHVFQVAEAINATNAESGEECVLGAGDLLRFAAPPPPDLVSAPMRVVTGRATSCQAGSVVEIGAIDLQQMMNGFAQRLEQNMQRAFTAVQPEPGQPAANRL